MVAELKSLKSLLKPLDRALSAYEDLQAMIEMAEEDGDLRPRRFQADRETRKDGRGPPVAGPARRPDGQPFSAAVDQRPRRRDRRQRLGRCSCGCTSTAQKNDYKVELLDRQDNGRRGSTALIAVRGPMAYGYLKGEEGMHRLVRISPFNSGGKRTSFASIDVTPEVDESTDIEIDWENDVREDIFRARRRGGQRQQDLQRQFG